MDQYPRTEKIADQYYRIQKIGEGTYGAVYKAINLLTNQICALKKIRADQNDDGVSWSAIREISILKEMQHENIVKLQDVLQHGESLWIALEYLDMDLKKYMDSHPTIVKNPSMIKGYDRRHKFQDYLNYEYKRFMHQMLSGIAHCHSHRIMHRDLKPANLLLDCHTNTLKLADFGMARAIQIPIRAYSHEVVTLGYRAPEILLGLQNYSLPVDVWSAGCIFAELLRGEPLFSGSSQISHLFRIFRLLGTPDEKSWFGVYYLSHFQPIFPQWCPQDLQIEFPGADPDGIDLLSRMLQLDPSRRITAKEALSHRYFIDVGLRV